MLRLALLRVVQFADRVVDVAVECLWIEGVILVIATVWVFGFADFKILNEGEGSLETCIGYEQSRIRSSNRSFQLGFV